ncbi:MAG: lytic transglycosylase domain-containing protein [bacterium]
MKKNINYFIIAVTCVFLYTAIIILQIYSHNQSEAELRRLHIQAEQLKSFAKIDKIRKYNIEKVISVINRYNPAMPEELKYKIASEISDVSMKYDNLDVDLICATITHESALTWDPTVVSNAGAMGLMQVMPSTAEFLARIEGIEWTSSEEILFSPIVNIRLGSRYLSSLIELYEIDGGLAAYNGGGKRAQMWLAQNRAEGILYDETQRYVPAVLSLYDQFRFRN